jgi:restriction system protein
MASPKIYLARAGKYGEDEEYALTENVAIVGFRDVPSLEAAKNYEDVLAIVSSAMPGEKPRALGNIAGQLWAFRLAMVDGDIVVLPKKTSPDVALGIVDGPYSYQ